MLTRGKIEGDFLLVDECLDKELKENFPPILHGILTKKQGQYNITALKFSAHVRPVGFVDFIMARGKMEGDMVILDEATEKELLKKFPIPVLRLEPPAPTLIELATNFTNAMANWADAGFRVVEKVEYERRHTVCFACEFWVPDAMLGIGKCKKCGCSKFKLWLVTSKCPDKPPRW